MRSIYAILVLAAFTVFGQASPLEDTCPLMVHEDKPFTEERPQWVRYETQNRDRGIPEWDEPEI